MGLDPEVLAERRGEGAIEQALRVPEALDCWPGHFPVRAIVPGVLQLSWVVQLAERWLGPARLLALEGLKFKRPIGPGQHLTLTLEAAPRRVHFRLADGDTVFSLGRLVTEPESPS
jgi:3-hydroxymyristoyl/3-hydroxydecanoyl-(acyl carrier protein) dehydratase